LSSVSASFRRIADILWEESCEEVSAARSGGQDVRDPSDDRKIGACAPEGRVVSPHSGRVKMAQQFSAGIEELKSFESVQRTF
jgi:hypothetical protein